MKTLNWYVTKSFIVTFAMSMGVLTFCMLGARFFKEFFEKVSNGLPISEAGILIVYLLPGILTWTIPWTTLVAVMLVFGRLSADSEITAMRACGVSILQIISPILLLVLALTGICFYLQMGVGPDYLGRARTMGQEVIVSHPLAFLTPGRESEFEGIRIYIDDRVGKDEIKGIQIYRLDKDGKNIMQDITASRGRVGVNQAKQEMIITLFNCTIISYDGNGGNKKQTRQTRTFSKEFMFSLNYGKEFNSMDVTKRIKYMRVEEIFGTIRMYNKSQQDTTAMEVELNQRIAFALSPIAFLLLGLPMAIRTSRRETSIGLFLSLVLAAGYFLAIIICDSLTGYPKIFPQYLLWLPNILYQACGIYLLVRIVRR
jgi:lipopolysaccharide export LptBFGC system permease protein LptF